MVVSLLLSNSNGDSGPFSFLVNILTVKYDKMTNRKINGGKDMCKIKTSKGWYDSWQFGPSNLKVKIEISIDVSIENIYTWLPWKINIEKQNEKKIVHLQGKDVNIYNFQKITRPKFPKIYK